MSGLDIARGVLSELAKRFDDVAVKVVTRDTTMLKLWNSQPSVVQVWRDVYVNLLLGKQRRLAVLEFRVGSPEEVLKALARVGEHLVKAEESELYTPLPAPGAPKPLTGGYDRRVLDFRQDPRPLAETMVSAALSSGAERVAGTLELEETSVSLATSAGFSGEYSKTRVMAYLRSFRGEVSGHWAYGSTYMDERGIEEVGRRSAELLELAMRREEFTPGRYDVVLSPLVVGNLLNYVAFMSSALAILMGMSFLVGKSVGDAIASEVVTISDAPRDTELPGTAPFDDEGVETYDKPIVDRGKLTSVLHNTATARVFKASSTGNSGWLNPRPWNIVVEPGTSSLDQMISEVRDGYLIVNNWYTRLQNYVEGQFSTVARDVVLRIRDGSVVGYVDRVRIADRFERLLKGVKAVGRDTYRITWWEVRTPTKAPYLLVEGVNLTKPT